jgi:hypothetical protein
MFSIASPSRLAAAGLVLVVAAAMPSVVHADLPNPDPGFQIPGSYPWPVLRLPDLVVDSPRTLVRDDVVSPSVTLRNVGTGDTATGYVLDVTLQWIPAGYDLVRETYRDSTLWYPLRAGESRDAYLPRARLRSGDTLIVTVVIDATNLVWERSERNNRLEFRFTMP